MNLDPGQAAAFTAIGTIAIAALTLWVNSRLNTRTVFVGEAKTLNDMLRARISDLQDELADVRGDLQIALTENAALRVENASLRSAQGAGLGGK